MEKIEMKPYAMVPCKMKPSSMNIIGTSDAEFSPYSLFRSGEKGVFFDPSDFTTLFQDTAGTTPVTAVEQPVGLMLDKSNGVVLGSELVTNGDFSNGTTGWSLGANFSVTGSKLVANNVTSGVSATNVGSVTANKWYLVIADIVCTAGNFSLNIGSVGTAVGIGTYSYRYYVLATSTGNVAIQQRGSSFTGTIDNISVRELTGNHAYQPTSAARPVLSARYNLFTSTEDISVSPWYTTRATVTTNKVNVDSSSGTHLVYTSVALASGVSYKISIEAKKGEFDFVNIKGEAPIFDNSNVFFNLATGQIGDINGTATATITPIGDGYYRCSIVVTTVSAGTAYVDFFPARVNGSLNIDGSIYSGGVYLRKASITTTNEGVGIPEYQRVTSSTDYDTVGFPKYLKFDGVDDALQTASIDFTATDKMTVWAGARKQSDAARGSVVGCGPVAQNFEFYAPNSNGGTSITGGIIGNIATVGNTSISAPYSFVLASAIDIGGVLPSDELKMRLNGGSWLLGGGTPSTGNFTAQSIYIGARGGTSLFFNGRLYALVVRGAKSSVSQVQKAEKYMNLKTKAY